MPPWKDITANEFYAFVGLVLHAGAHEANLDEAKDLFAEHNMPIYRATMSLERFEQIIRFLRFDDTQTRPARLQSDKLASIRCVWSLFLENLNSNYQPSKELCIEEQLLNTSKRCPIRQYILSKPGQRGIKINWIVDASTRYPLFGEIYVGTGPNKERSTDRAHQLVKRLANRWLGTSSNITMDNSFTSYPLATDLWRNHKTTIVGRMRINKGEIPTLFSSADAAEKRGGFSSVFGFSDECQLTSYTTNEFRNVVVLSTAHANYQTDSSTRANQPLAILDYNKFKGGADSIDKMVRGYTSKRQGCRWPVAIFYNMIDVGALAALRLYELSHPMRHARTAAKRKVFLKELAKELINEHLHDRCKQPDLLEKSTLDEMRWIGFKPFKPSSKTSRFPNAQPTQVNLQFSFMNLSALSCSNSLLA